MAILTFRVNTAFNKVIKDIDLTPKVDTVYVEKKLYKCPICGEKLKFDDREIAYCCQHKYYIIKDELWEKHE